MEEIYIKACESRDWSWVRLTAGLLHKQLDELSKAVTHLLVRQKQLTVGMPTKSEEAITCPKTKEELREIFVRSYPDDPNSFTLAQEIIVSLGSLVRTDQKLFDEMFRMRIGLIIQVIFLAIYLFFKQQNYFKDISIRISSYTSYVSY